MGSAKVEALVQICEEGHKAIVFSQWTGFLDWS
jgi:SNF2 family DNA or RNA helicase